MTLRLSKRHLIIALATFAVVAAGLFLVAHPSFAQFGIGETVKTVQGDSETSQFGRTGDIPTIIANIISAALGLVGAIFFLLMLYAGFLWMMARGNEDSVRKAKGILSNAIIGIIIIAGAYAITNFVIRNTLSSGETSSADVSDTDEACVVPNVPCEIAADCPTSFGYTGSCNILDSGPPVIGSCSLMPGCTH